MNKNSKCFNEHPRGLIIVLFDQQSGVKPLRDNNCNHHHHITIPILISPTKNVKLGQDQ